MKSELFEKYLINLRGEIKHLEVVRISFTVRNLEIASVYIHVHAIVARVSLVLNLRVICVASRFSFTRLLIAEQLVLAEDFLELGRHAFYVVDSHDEVEFLQLSFRVLDNLFTNVGENDSLFIAGQQ